MSHLLRKQRHRSRSLSDDAPPDFSNVNSREFNSVITTSEAQEQRASRRHSSLFKIKKDPNSPSGIFNIDNYEEVSRNSYSSSRSSPLSNSDSSNPFPGIRLHSVDNPPQKAETALDGLHASKSLDNAASSRKQTQQQQQPQPQQQPQEEDDGFVITPASDEEDEEEDEVKESPLESPSSSTAADSTNTTEAESAEKGTSEQPTTAEKSERELRKAKALLRNQSMFMAKVFEFAPRRTVPTQVFKSQRVEVLLLTRHCCCCCL